MFGSIGDKLESPSDQHGIYIFHMSRHGNFCLEKVCVGSITNRNAIPYKRIYMFYLYNNSVGWGGRLRPHEIRAGMHVLH